MDRRVFVVVAFVALMALLAVPAVATAADLAGTIKSVAPDAKSLVVTADGKDNTVTWDDATAVTKADGSKGTAADLKAGAKVTVTHTGGKASKIALSP
jgi:hypothetical protein